MSLHSSPHDRLHRHIADRLQDLDLVPERSADIEAELTAWLLDAAEAEGLALGELDDTALDAWLHRELADGSPLVDQLSRSDARHRRPASSRAVTPRPLPRGASFLTHVLHELRFSLRGLRRRPAFALIAMLTLGLGVGVVAAVFSTVDAVVFKPVDVADADRLMNLYGFTQGGMAEHEPLSRPDLRDIEATLPAVSDVESYAMAMMAVDDGQVRLVIAEQVSDGFFGLLGIRPALGRLIDGEDRGALHAVLSHQTWQQHYGADPGVIGKSLRAGGRTFTVVGVAPERFRGLFQGLAPELWIHLDTGKQIGLDPLQSSGPRAAGLDLYEDRGRRWLWSVARLADGADHQQLQRELSGLTDRLQQDFPDLYEKLRFTAVPTASVRLIPDFDRPLATVGFMALIVAGLVLLIACANLANMLLARAVGRGREFAMRRSLGAGRFDLVRQLSVENLWIALGGGLLGLAIAKLAVFHIQHADLPSPVPLDFGIEIDHRVFFVVLICTLAVCVGLAWVPVAAVARGRLAQALREGAAGSGYGPRRLRSSLVVVQVALSAVLLVGAGLMTRSLAASLSADPGFNPDGVVAATFAPQLQGLERERIREAYRLLDERLEAIPGVEAVSSIDHLPLRFEADIFTLNLEDNVSGAPPRQVEVDTALAEAGYFEVMKIPLLAGRGFAAQDADGAPAVVINQALASEVWPDEPVTLAVGRTLQLEQWDEPATVIGVTRNGAYRSLGETPRPFLYTNASQLFDPMRAVVIRHTGPAQPVFRAVRRLSREIDEDFAVLRLETLKEAYATSAFVSRFGSLLLGILGAVGLTLSAVGLYGILLLRVDERRRALGIRLALGDSRVGVIRRVVLDGLRLVIVGLGAGYLAAALAADAVGSLLYGVGPRDPVTFLAVSAVLLATGLVAGPARVAHPTGGDPASRLSPPAIQLDVVFRLASPHRASRKAQQCCN